MPLTVCMLIAWMRPIITEPMAELPIESQWYFSGQRNSWIK